MPSKHIVKLPWLSVVLFFSLCVASDSFAQSLLQVPESEQETPAVTGPSYSDPQTTKWRVGARLKNGSRAVRNVLITLPVPNNWPEQRVSLLKEEIPANFGRVGFRELESGVQQVLIQIPIVQPQQEVKVAVVMEVETRAVKAPPEVERDSFVLPKSRNREAKNYLGVSPDVNNRDSKFRRFVAGLVDDQPSAWKKAQAIFDWVRDEVESSDEHAKDSLETFRNKQGDNENRVFLFVAMCRSAKIPARIVFSKGMAYAEFMLASPDQEEHYWFPCNVTGVYEFGEFLEPRLIMQKGDNIRVPEKQQRQKLVAEFLKCSGSVRPSVRFIRETAQDLDDE